MLLQINITSKIIKASGKLPCKLVHKRIINGIANQYFSQNFSLKTTRTKKENRNQEKTLGESVKNEAKEEMPTIKKAGLNSFNLDTETQIADKNKKEHKIDIPVEPATE
jgi:uncharacterized membrane protein YcgQ (UPF0703/DUF1980 family)